MRIGIVGAGASGMAAAIAASENPDNSVILFERQARVGRKLQATGNGRCNLTNRNLGTGNYHGENPAFATDALTVFGVEETLRWFRSLGLYTVTEESGRVYPYSDQANSVADVLRFELERKGVQLKAGVEVSRVKKDADGFWVTAGEERIRCDRLIIACGGLAGTKLGGYMSGYRLLKSFGHGCTRLRPSLVQLKSSWKGCVSLKGVRANCHVAVCRNGIEYSESTGQLQFTEYGLSGPVIFEVSRDVCQNGGEWICKLDFLPDETKADLMEELTARKDRDLPMEELLTGMLHNRLGRVLTQAAGLRSQGTSGGLRQDELESLCTAIKNLEVSVTDTMGMDSAQVTAGGVLTDGFDPITMESRLVPGLYACGEVLDIDGDCGGFNLQWAWSSGTVAGRHAGGVTL